jgi:alpha-tubulin suppressor-like RCC1 family protein
VLYCWGRGAEGQLGSGVRTRELDPTPVTGSETLRFKSVYADEFGTCALSLQGSVFCWGIAGGKNLGSTPTPVQPPRAFTQLSMGNEFVCGLDATGRAWCWGTATRGELGNGVKAGTWDTAQPVSGDHVFKQIESGAVHTCALTPDGEVFCWGASGVSGKPTGLGQADPPSDPAEYVPQPLHEARRFKDLSTADGFTCVLSLRDIPLCWGQRPAYKDSGLELHPTPIITG